MTLLSTMAPRTKPPCSTRIMTDTNQANSPPCPSVSWMEVSPARRFLLLSSLALRPISKPVLSGMITDRKLPISATDNIIKDFPTFQARIAVRRLALSPLEDGLGYSTKGAPLGKPLDRLAIFCGLHAGYTFELQVEGRRHSVCAEAGL